MKPVRTMPEASLGRVWLRPRHVLGGVGLVMHQEKIDVLDVMDEEGLVARGHHVASLLVRSEADLWVQACQVSERAISGFTAVHALLFPLLLPCVLFSSVSLEVMAGQNVPKA